MIEKIKIPIDVQEKADKLVKKFLGKKIYPFNDMVWAIRKSFDEETAENILPAIKQSYYAYLSDATDMELEKMSSVDYVKNFGTVEGAIKPKEEIKEGFIKEIEKVDLSSHYKPFNEQLKQEIKKQEKKEEVILPPQIEMRVTKDYIQWRSNPKDEWKNLILIERLKGDKGDKGDKGESGPQGLQGRRSIATTQSSVTKAEIEKVLIGLIKSHYHEGSGKDSETFETVNKNIKSWNVIDSTVNTLTYSNGIDEITKTITQPDSDTVVITLSGNTPDGINLVKTIKLYENKLPTFNYS